MFYQKAPANSSSLVLMRWIMRHSKVTNRFEFHLIHTKKLSHYICQLKSRSHLWSWTRCKWRRFFHADMRWIIDDAFHRAVMRIYWGQSFFFQWNLRRPIRRFHSAVVSTLGLLIGRDSCQSSNQVDNHDIEWWFAAGFTTKHCGSSSR